MGADAALAGGEEAAWPPKQGPQPGGSTEAPASASAWSAPERTAAWNTVRDAGATMRRTPGEIAWPPRRTAAAASRSSRRPFVQEPMKAWSMRVPSTSPDRLDVVDRVGERDLRLEP